MGSFTIYNNHEILIERIWTWLGDWGNRWKALGHDSCWSRSSRKHKFVVYKGNQHLTWQLNKEANRFLTTSVYGCQLRNVVLLLVITIDIIGIRNYSPKTNRQSMKWIFPDHPQDRSLFGRVWQIAVFRAFKEMTRTSPFLTLILTYPPSYIESIICHCRKFC